MGRAVSVLRHLATESAQLKHLGRLKEPCFAESVSGQKRSSFSRTLILKKKNKTNSSGMTTPGKLALIRPLFV